MYRKEWTVRSPLRIFERSIHGGLGRGNIGVVFSRAGVGKTAFLVGVALDDLLQGKQVLHVSLGDSVHHVRAFYDDVFTDLAHTTALADQQASHLMVERHRYIHTFRGDSFSLQKLEDSLGFLREHAQFEPALIVVDGYPTFDGADHGALETEVKALKQLASTAGAELWISALSHRDDRDLDARGVPKKIARVDAHIDVLVSLEPQADHVKLRILKDHDNLEIADLHMELDPTSLLLKWH